MYVAEAKAGLWDYQWASRLKVPVLRSVQAAWQAAFAAVADGGAGVDLAAEGKDGEYEELPVLKAEIGKVES